MSKLADFLEKWCFRLSAAALVTICLIIGWQVFARKLLNDSPSWSEPLALLLLLYCVMLATAAGCRRHLHIGLAWFRQKFPQSLHPTLLTFEYAGCALLGVAMAYYGLNMTLKTAGYLLPGLPISMGVQYFSLALGGVLIAFFCLYQLVQSSGSDQRGAL